MRVLFTDDNDSSTAHDDGGRRLRARVIEQSEALATYLERGVADERVIAEIVKPIDDRIEVELIEEGPACTIVLSARGERTLNNVIALIVESVHAHAAQSAKRAFSAVSVVQHRPPASVSMAIERVQRELGIDVSDARVRAGFARGHLLELAVHSSAFASGADERALDAAELAVVTLLGERVFDDWIGDVRVAPMPRKSILRVLDNNPVEERTYALAELADVVAAAVRGLIDGLPDKPIWQRASSSEWTMFELEPEVQYDYALQDDLAIATTFAPELLKCFLRGQPFSSARFSRFGERFCYLKLDGDGERSEPRLLARRALEDALSEALPHASAGAVIGNGLGIRYSYVDLALANLDAAVHRTLEVARSSGVPRRSWLLFCDGDLGDEWIGVWPETPAPLLTRG